MVTLIRLSDAALHPDTFRLALSHSQDRKQTSQKMAARPHQMKAGRYAPLLTPVRGWLIHRSALPPQMRGLNWRRIVGEWSPGEGWRGIWTRSSWAQNHELSLPNTTMTRGRLDRLCLPRSRCSVMPVENMRRLTELVGGMRQPRRRGAHYLSDGRITPLLCFAQAVRQVRQLRRR
jgi:hypothetical protein